MPEIGFELLFCDISNVFLSVYSFDRALWLIKAGMLLQGILTDDHTLNGLFFLI